MDAPKNERKDIRVWSELKGAELSENTISGAAAVIGNVDSYGDVLFPGCVSRAVITDFLKTGFVPDTHDWGSMAKLVAMPKAVSLRGREVVGEAKFHSTDYAQTVRTICQERISEGLAVGLSIGFSIDYGDSEARMWFEDGKQMAKYIKDAGLDATLFDMKGIEKYPHCCRGVFKLARIFEYSPVPIPANPQANAHSVKQFASDPGLLTGLEFEEHSDAVLNAVRGWIGRVSDYAQMRGGQGRPLSQSRVAEIEQAKSLIDELHSLVAPVEPETRSHHDLRARASARLRKLRTAIG